jgi:hypothetical protein
MERLPLPSPDHPFRLGPLEHMVALPSPAASKGLDTSYKRSGATQTSLTGRTTLDRFDTKRSWKFGWTVGTLSADGDRLLRSRWLGLVHSPLRLLDVTEPNLLGMDAASSGAVSSTLGAFTAAGSPQLKQVRLDTTPDPLSGLIDIGLQLTGSGTVFPDYGVPFPTLADVTATVWAKGSGTVQPGIRPAGRGLDDNTADVNGTAVTLDGTWQQLTMTYPATSSPHGAVFGVYAASGTTVDFTAWQCSTDPAAEWSTGGGCPVVVLLDYKRSVKALGYPTASLTVQEV